MKKSDVSEETMSNYYGFTLEEFNKVLLGYEGFNYRNMVKTADLLGVDMRTLLEEKKYIPTTEIVFRKKSDIDESVLRIIERGRFIIRFLNDIDI